LKLLIKIVELSPEFYSRSERFKNDILPHIKLLLTGTDLKTQTSLIAVDQALRLVQKIFLAEIESLREDGVERRGTFGDLKKMVLQKVTNELLSSEVCKSRIEAIEKLEC